MANCPSPTRKNCCTMAARPPSPVVWVITAIPVGTTTLPHPLTERGITARSTESPTWYVASPCASMATSL